jgi:hypothetical protein
MAQNIAQLEQGALQYAQKELSELAIAAKFLRIVGSKVYFEPQYKPSPVSSTGDIHLITYNMRGRQYGVTFSQEEIEGVTDGLS